MAFRGQHEHSLDSKDRLTIPSKLRSQLAGGVVVSASFDPCVEIWPADGFDEYSARVQATTNPLAGDARLIRRRIQSMSSDGELDSAGRVRIPGNLLKHADLSGPCMVVGVGDHLEVWSPERWDAQETEMESKASKVAEELAAPDWSGK